MNYLVLLFIFIAAIQLPLDLDLGWHLRYGEYFFKTGHVLYDNILSYFWPTYHWVQASWGYDLLTYQIFSHFGFLGLSIVGALFVVTTFWLIVRPIKNWSVPALFILAVIFLSHTLPMYSASLRSQTPSALMFALIFILYEQLGAHARRGELFRVLALPFLFFLWANFHGGFALGLILLWIMWGVEGCLLLFRKVRHAKPFLIKGLIIILSSLTPLLNPWGTRIYEETLKHATNVNLSFIGEWTPLTGGTVETIMASLLILIVFLVAIKRRTVQDLPYLVAFGLVSLLAFSAIRFVTNFGIMATYYLARSNALFHAGPAAGFPPRPPTKGTPAGGGPPTRVTRFFKLLAISLFIVILFDMTRTNHYFVFSAPKLINFSWNTYCKTLGTCSEGVTATMLKDPPRGNGYHPYNYGGYISWRVPMVKTFLDGRMAAWVDENGATPPIASSDRIFEDREPIMFRKFESEYHFSWVIIPSVSLLNEFLAKDREWAKVFADSSYSYYIKGDASRTIIPK